MTEYKEKLNNLLDKLSPKQIEFLYHFTAKLFGPTPD